MTVFHPSRAAATLLAATALSLAPRAFAADTSTTPHHHHHHASTSTKTAATAAHHAKHGTGHATPHGTAHGTAKSSTPATHHHKTHKEHAPHPVGAHPEPKHPKHGTPAPHASVTPVPVPGSAPSDAPDAASGDTGTTTPTTAAPEPPKGSNTGLPLPRFAAFRADEVNMRAGPGQRYPIQWVYHRRGLPVQIEREFDVWRLVEDSAGVKGWVHQATLVGTRDFVIPGDNTSVDQPVTPAAAPPAPTAQPAVPSSESTGTAPEAGATAGAQTAAQPETHPTAHMESRVLGAVATEADAAKIPGAVMLRASGDDSASLIAVLQPGTVGTLRICAAGSAWCKVSVRQYDGWVKRNAIWGVSPGEAFPPS